MIQQGTPSLTPSTLIYHDMIYHNIYRIRSYHIISYQKQNKKTLDFWQKDVDDGGEVHTQTILNVLRARTPATKQQQQHRRGQETTHRARRECEREHEHEEPENREQTRMSYLPTYVRTTTRDENKRGGEKIPGLFRETSQATNTKSSTFYKGYTRRTQCVIFAFRQVTPPTPPLPTTVYRPCTTTPRRGIQNAGGDTKPNPSMTTKHETSNTKRTTTKKKRKGRKAGGHQQ